MQDPKNIFILHEAIGGNLFEFDQVIKIHDPKYKDNEIVKEYYRLFDMIISNYNDFASKYIAH